VEKSSDNSSVFLCLVSQEFSSSWDIRATPTFFFLKNGQQVDKLVGANKPELEKKVAAAASSSGGVAPDAK
jgi:thioredoxin 1